MKKYFIFLSILSFILIGCSKAVPEPRNVEGIGSGDEASTREELDMSDYQDLTEEEKIYLEEETNRREIEDLGLISFDEVTQHNSVDDCWMVIGGQVLDVTEFIAFHPGGQTILQGCGQEASELFATRPMGSGMSHSDDAYALLADYFIGDILQ